MKHIYAGHVIAGVVLQFRIDGTPQRHLVRYPAVLGEKEAIAENDFMCGHEGLAENRFVDPMPFFQPNRVVGAGPVGFAFHAASFALRVSRQVSAMAGRTGLRPASR